MITKVSKVLIIEYIILVLISLNMIYTWAIMLTAWFGLAVYIKIKKLDIDIPKPKILNTTIILYPAIETFIKWMIIYNIIPYSWNFLNRIEHFLFSLCLTILIYPLFYKASQKVSKFEAVLLVIGTVVLIGNLNELFEYALRVKMATAESTKAIVYYWDTIFDLAINIFGSIVGYIIIKTSERKHL